MSDDQEYFPVLFSSDTTIDSLIKMAVALGLELRIELIDKGGEHACTISTQGGGEES